MQNSLRRYNISAFFSKKIWNKKNDCQTACTIKVSVSLLTKTLINTYAKSHLSSQIFHLRSLPEQAPILILQKIKITYICVMPKHEFSYQEYDQPDLLAIADQQLLDTARKATQNAYAPYSQFRVACAVRLQNGQVLSGVNIENASYPVGICAERSALAATLSQYPHERIESIAISYDTPRGNNQQPAFPCGMCRQFIAECEEKNGQAISLILAAQKGKVIVINSARDLLPFSFGRKDLAVSSASQDAE